MKKARDLDDKIRESKEALSKLQSNANPSSSLRIEVSRCCEDSVGSFTNRIEFKSDIADLLFTVIVSHLECQIALLEKQLDSL